MIVSDLLAEIYEHVLDPHQQLWMDQILSNRYVYILGSRQIGKSFLIALAAVCLGLGVKTKSGSIPAHDVLILSKDQRTSANVVREVSKHLRAFGLAADVVDKRKGSETRIALSNGQYITALPGSASVIQGFTGSVIMDEMEASKADSEELLGQALPVASKKDHYKIICVTNAGPKGGFTDNLFNLEDARWVARRELFKFTNTTIYDVHPDGLPEHIQQDKLLMHPNEWRRWYENESVEGIDSLIPIDLLTRTHAAPLPIDGPVRVLSIDCGFVSDPSGVVLAEYGQGKLNVLQAQRWWRLPMQAQLDKIHHIVREHKPSKILIDVGAQGHQMAKTLQAKYPTMTTGKSTNRNSRNRDAATLHRLISESEIYIPPHLECLIDDITSIYLNEKGDVEIPRRPGPIRTYEDGEKIKHKIHGDTADALLQIMDYVPETYKRQSAVPKKLRFSPSAFSRMF